jgi:hypothetical protein
LNTSVLNKISIEMCTFKMEEERRFLRGIFESKMEEVIEGD